MFKKRGLLLVMLSLVIAAGAAWVANNYVKTKLTAAAAGNVPPVTVVAAAMRIPYGTKLQSPLSSCPSLPVRAGRSPSVPISIAAAHRDSQGERHRTDNGTRKAERNHSIHGPLRCSRIARADRRARRLRRSRGHIPSGANGGTGGNARFRRPRSRPRPA